MDPQPLLDWYARVRRPLPWRETRDPYAILVSEVMLQQTQAARVVPYYERWLARWPDPAALAAADPADVLRAWSGLGYNRRALALQRAAAQVAEHGWPDDLRRLPGVGPYTAAAVASFAFGAAVAAVDVNWRRVEARHGSAPPPGPLVNQAMMELGATVCTARRARCGECPVRPGCARRPDPPPRRRQARFEGSIRQLRGRTVAAVLAGEPLPEGAERVLDGLVRDGLVDRDQAGVARPPRR
jgi:A/G-specific adenine glycosylase